MLEGLAGVARLAAGFASAVLAPQGFGFALQAIAGGRFAAVGAVHVETLFKLRDTRHKLLNPGFKAREKLANRIQPTRIECGLDYGAQGFGSLAYHLAIIDTREIAKSFLKT